MSFDTLIGLVDDNDLEKLRQAGKFSAQAKSKQHTLLSLRYLKSVYTELSNKYKVDIKVVMLFAENLGKKETFSVKKLSGFKDLQIQVESMGV